MSEKDHLALVLRPPSSLELTESPAKRVLSGMIADTLALVKPSTIRARRIIILDDETFVREIYLLALKDALPGLEILEFADGDATWLELSRSEPDLLITDINHLGVSCSEMLARLTERKVRYPIFVISGHAARFEEVQRCCGPNLKVTFMRKPLLAVKLIEAVGLATRIQPRRTK